MYKYTKNAEPKQNKRDRKRFFKVSLVSFPDDLERYFRTVCMV